MMEAAVTVEAATAALEPHKISPWVNWKTCNVQSDKNITKHNVTVTS
jgi:hypothetical protein